MSKPKPPLQFIIHLEGGIVHGVFCTDPHLPYNGADFFVMDYDTDGADVEELAYITQPNGREVPACITRLSLTQPAIDLKEVTEYDFI